MVGILRQRKDKEMRILVWIIMVGSCAGSMYQNYITQVNKFYNEPTSIEIIESLKSGSFD